VLKIDWLPVTKFEQNCSIMWCERTRKAVVVDPGGDLYGIQTFLELEEFRSRVALWSKRISRRHWSRPSPWQRAPTPAICRDGAARTRWTRP
jgi:hypothetical protein